MKTVEKLLIVAFVVIVVIALIATVAWGDEHRCQWSRGGPESQPFLSQPGCEGWFEHVPRQRHSFTVKLGNGWRVGTHRNQVWIGRQEDEQDPFCGIASLPDGGSMFCRIPFVIR